MKSYTIRENTVMEPELEQWCERAPELELELCSDRSELELEQFHFYVCSKALVSKPQYT